MNNIEFNSKINGVANTEINNAGFGLVEMLIGILLAAIMGAAVASNLTNAMRTGIRFDLNYAANSIANSKLELLAATNASSLDASDNTNEADLSYPNLNTTFDRDTVIVVNPDLSRTATVTVSTSQNATIPLTVTQQTTFSIWQ